MVLASIQTDTGVLKKIKNKKEKGRRRETLCFPTKTLFLKRQGFQGAICFLGKHFR